MALRGGHHHARVPEGETEAHAGIRGLGARSIGLRAEAARGTRPAARPLSLPLPRGTRVCARPGRGHSAAAGHADRSPREGGLCRRWRRRAEAFRVGPRLPPAVTQVVAGRRRLCGGQEVWLRAPRPHVRPVPWPALEGRPSIFPPLPPTRRRHGVRRAAGRSARRRPAGGLGAARRGHRTGLGGPPGRFVAVPTCPSPPASCSEVWNPSHSQE